MRKRLTHFSPVRTAWTIAVLYFVVFLILWIIFAIVSMVMKPQPDVDRPAMIWGALIAVVIYPIIGFVATLVSAWIYNLVAKWTGGIEFTLTDSDQR